MHVGARRVWRRMGEGDSARNHENRRKKKKTVENVTSISGRRDGMSHEPRSRLYLGGNVKIHCVIALAFRLRAGEEKSFRFPPRVYARRSIFHPSGLECGKRKNCSGVISGDALTGERLPRHKSQQICDKLELHSSSSCVFCDAERVFVSRWNRRIAFSPLHSFCRAFRARSSNASERV